MQLKRPDWKTGEMTYRPVNERVVQEVINIVLGRHWLDLMNDERFEYRRRRWIAELETVDPAPIPTPGTDDAFRVRVLQSEGLSVAEIKATTGLSAAVIKQHLIPATV